MMEMRKFALVTDMPLVVAIGGKYTKGTKTPNIPNTLLSTIKRKNGLARRVRLIISFSTEVIGLIPADCFSTPSAVLNRRIEVGKDK